MRAVTLSEANRLQVSDVPPPEPGPGQVVVHVAACGICGSDLHMVEGGLVQPGTIMGHEVSGVVDEVGSGVSVARGTPVAIYPLEPCGRCPACRQGASGRCQTSLATTIGLGLRPGGYAERMAVAESMLRPMPTSVPPEMGALAEPLAVALRGLKRSRFEPEMTVGVVGCGPIGLSAVLAARALGAKRVWASDVNEFRANLALRAGADAASPTPETADIVVECAGARGTLNLAVGAARDGGQVVLLAVNMKEDVIHPFALVVKEVEIVPSLAHTFEEYDEAAEFIASGRVDPSAIVTRRIPLEGADEAFFALLDGAPEGKILVTP